MDRSKSEKEQKGGNSADLKKELSNASKNLHSLASKLDVLENELVDSKTALAAEKRLKEENIKLRKQLEELQVQKEKETESFATSFLRLQEDFHGRVAKVQKEYDVKLQDVQKNLTETEKQLEGKLAMEHAKAESLRAKESATRRELDNRSKEVETKWKGVEGEMRKEADKLRAQLNGLRNSNNALTKDLQDHRTILRGRETEKEQLTKKLAGIEAFRPMPLDSVQTTLAGFQQTLEDFCQQCIGQADILPGGNLVPEALQRPELPLYYLQGTPTGQSFITALIQNSITTAMLDYIFVDAPPCSSDEVKSIANSLQRMNPSHEAIWRLMTANAMLSDSQMLADYKHKMSDISEDLLSSWKLFHDKSLRNEMQHQLTDVLFDAFNVWLGLMLIQDKIYVSHTGAREYFNSGSEGSATKSEKIPGDFMTSDAVPVLCLFPAFLRHPTHETATQPSLICKGTVIYEDSPILLQAMKESQDIKSPKLSNRRFSRAAENDAA